MEPSRRLFAAVPLDEKIRNEIDRVIREASQIPSSIKWVGSGHLHLTLSFLGETPGVSLPGVVEAMSRSAGETPSFELELGGLGGFPDLARPRVLFIPILRGGDESLELARKLYQGLAERGLKLEKRDFHAHVTIARIKEPQGLRDAVRILEQQAPQSLGVMKVEKFVLFRSRLTPKGPVYTIEKEFQLQSIGSGH